MQLIHPFVLFGLLAIAIPIAIHLFNFRRYRKVYFSNVRFLQQLERRTKKQSRLLHLLVLAARILVISSLVMAFAQPYIPASSGARLQGVQSISVFVDNSFSMESTGKNGRLLDEARNLAKEVASAYAPDDRFQLLTNDFDGRYQRFFSRDEFIEMLRDIKLSASYRNLNQIVTRQNELLRTQKTSAKSAYIISDFQQSTLLQQLPDSSDYPVFLVPVAAENQQNLTIDTLWFENPLLRQGQTATLHLRIRNTGNTDLEKIPLKLWINHTQRSVAAIDIPASGSATTTLSFRSDTAGVFKGRAEISDFPVTFDDNYYFSFKVSDHIPALIINFEEPNPYLNGVFALDSVISLSNASIKQLDYSTLSSYRLIVLNGLTSLTTGAISEISRFVENGGSLLVFPDLQASPEALNALTHALNINGYGLSDSSRIQVKNLNTRHELFAGVFDQGSLGSDNVDLPVINKRFILTEGVGTENLITLENGQPLLTIARPGAGKVYLSAVSLSSQSGNWPRHAIFVPAMLNVAFQSQEVMPLMHYTGMTGAIDLGSLRPEKREVFTIRGETTDGDFIPQLKMVNGKSLLYINQSINEAGFYDVMDNHVRVSTLAFNYPPAESDLRLASRDNLQNVVNLRNQIQLMNPGKKGMAQTIADQSLGTHLWRWFILLALIFLAIEQVLLRFFRPRVYNVQNDHS
ncbi:BatA domain-containing protein [Lentimicrobium sp.]